MTDDERKAHYNFDIETHRLFGYLQGWFTMIGDKLPNRGQVENLRAALATAEAARDKAWPK
jgi:hypothetical protein